MDNICGCAMRATYPGNEGEFSFLFNVARILENDNVL